MTSHSKGAGVKNETSSLSDNYCSEMCGRCQDLVHAGHSASPPRAYLQIRLTVRRGGPLPPTYIIRGLWHSPFLDVYPYLSLQSVCATAHSILRKQSLQASCSYSTQGHTDHAARSSLVIQKRTFQSCPPNMLFIGTEDMYECSRLWPCSPELSCMVPADCATVRCAGEPVPLLTG